jgi:hypothetical protein
MRERHWYHRVGVEHRADPVEERKRGLESWIVEDVDRVRVVHGCAVGQRRYGQDEHPPVLGAVEEAAAEVSVVAVCASSWVRLDAVVDVAVWQEHEVPARDVLDDELGVIRRPPCFLQSDNDGQPWSASINLALVQCLAEAQRVAFESSGLAEHGQRPVENKCSLGEDAAAARFGE